MTYLSTKTYGHDLGLSAVFRQHRARSHCRMMHGYALGFTFTFSCEQLDERGWVVDFGSLAPLRRELEDKFDHRLLVAKDDPEYDKLCSLEVFGLADVVVVESVGCELFARMAFDIATTLLQGRDDWSTRGVRVVSVECKEHGANSAIYVGDD